MLALARLQPLIVGNQILVEDVQFLVPLVKLRLAQHRIIQEEPAAEVVDRLLGLRQELVRDERHVVACLPEQLREQGIVTPLSFLPYHMHREHILEHETGQVPGCHHVGIFHQQPAALTLCLPGGCRHEVAILLRVVPAETLADNQHDVRRRIRAAVHNHLVCRSHQFPYLLGSQLVGPDAECQTVGRRILSATIGLRQFVFHLPHRVERHQPPQCRLVLP